MEKELIFAANILDPSRRANCISEANRVNYKRVLSILEQNNVQLLFIKNKNSQYSSFYNLKEFRNKIEEEKRMFENWAREYSMVNEIFLQHGIEHILMKSDGHFPYLDDNLDIIVKPENITQAQSILEDLGYIEVTTSREPYKSLFVKFPPNGLFYDIHLHQSIAWHVPFIDDQYIWAKSIASKCENLNFYVFSPDVMALMNIAHIIYENHSITLPEVIGISVHLRNLTNKWEYLKGMAKQRGWLEGLYCGIFLIARIEEKIYGNTLIGSNILDEVEKSCSKLWKLFVCKRLNKNFRMPLKIDSKLCRILYIQKFLRDPKVTFLRRVKQLSIRIYKSISLRLPCRNKPFLISFSGIDGSGKTSYAKALEKAFQACCIETCYYWNKIGNPKMYRLFSSVGKVLFRQDNSFKNIQNWSIKDKIDFFAKKSLIRYLWMYLNMITLWIEYLFKVKLPLLLRKVVICDRYIYDALVDIDTFSPLSNKDINKVAITKIFRILSPKPNIFFLCNTPPEVAVKRERYPEAIQSIDVLNRKIRLYNQLSQKTNFVQIDSLYELPKIKSQIVNRALSVYFALYKVK